jgi:aromatic-L-amino-acid decarboxylase
MNFDLTPDIRIELWDQVISAIEDFYTNTSSLPVAPKLDLKNIRSYIAEFYGTDKNNLSTILEHVVTGMTKYAVHTPHPAYFGLFKPRVNFPGILADTLTASFNPQLAAWSHAPFAAEVEDYLIKLFGQKFGFGETETDGVFTTGGAEANLTALLCALNHAFPDYSERGLRSLNAAPVIYCSTESHHSIIKSARIAGLGSIAVRTIPVDGELKMDTALLRSMANEDTKNGFFPLMIVATAGTTGAGVIDPLIEIAEIARQNKIWLHTDAAFGGGLVLSGSASLLAGIEKSDSITFDAHKWLSVPMGTSMFLTRKKNILSEVFRINTAYMPLEGQQLEINDPFVHSIQWSRRFNGLKLYMALLMLGENSYRETIDNQIKMGGFLKQRLTDNGWEIYNNTPLPVVCFGKPFFKANDKKASEIAQNIIKRGKAWISVYPVRDISTLRACITNYNTGYKEIEVLLNELKTALMQSENSGDPV